MRKWFSILLALILSFIPVMAFAAQVPLTTKGKNVYVPDESGVELISYNVFFRIRTGYSSANTSIVIKNTNSDQAVTIQMGMPVQTDNVSKFRDLSVIIDGKQVKIIQRSSLKNPPTDKEINVKNWHVWDVVLEPGESKVVECSFSLDNKLELDGTETVTYPLDLLENWSGNIKNVQLIADLDFYAPYAFDPMPSITPIQYDNGGRLTFRLDNVQTFPSNFELSFKPMDVVITRYIEDKSGSDNDIKAILEAYKNKSYYKTVALIQEFLSDSNDSEIMVELKYLESLCYQDIYDMDKALNLLNQLEPNPGFGESLSGTFKNKIIYDKSTILKAQPDGNQKALEYLNSLKDSVADNSIFAMWMDQEITLLTPPPVVEAPEDDIEASEQENEEQTVDEPSNVIDKVSIGKYDFYIEEILIAALILLILIFIVIGMIRRKRRRRRGSIFRY